MRRALGFALCASLLMVGWTRAEADEVNQFYFAPEVGYVLPTDGSVDDTVFVGGRVGYMWDKNWAIELESGWLEYGLDLSDRFQNVDVDTVPIMANIRYSSSCRTGCELNEFGWYGFAGVGAAINDIDDKDLDGNPAGLDIENTVAWQIGLGVDYNVDNRIYPFIDVRYFWNQPDVDTDVVGNVGDADLQFVMFTAGVSF